MICIELDARLWLAEFIGGLVHHIDLFLASYTREVTIITNTNEQATTIGVGKSRYCFCQFAGIGNTIFEVLLLVFAFANEAEKIMFVVHTGYKSMQKF